MYSEFDMIGSMSGSPLTMQLIFSVNPFSTIRCLLRSILFWIVFTQTWRHYQKEKLCHGRRLEWSNTKKINWMCNHGARISTTNFSMSCFLSKKKSKRQKLKHNTAMLRAVNRFDHVQMSNLHHLYTKTKWMFRLIRCFEMPSAEELSILFRLHYLNCAYQTCHANGIFRFLPHPNFMLIKPVSRRIVCHLWKTRH